MSVLFNLAKFLEAATVGTVGTSIFIGHLPESPNACVAIYDAGGTPRPHGAEQPWAEHVFDFRVRAASYSAAETLALKVYAALDHKQNVLMNNLTTVHWIAPESTFALLEYDQQRRAIFIGRVVAQVLRSNVYTA